MEEAFLTTKRGFIANFTLIRYDFSDWVINNQSHKTKLVAWLKNKSGFLMHSIEDTCFFTFERLKVENTSQYKVRDEKIINAPFHNTQLISSFIAILLRRELSRHYRQFYNQNIFIVSTLNLEPFQLLQAFEFNIEVFSTGSFLIHLLPITKIVSSRPADLNYIKFLKDSNLNSSNTERMEFSLISTDKFYRLKFDLLNTDVLEDIKKMSDEKNSDAFDASFDYHFLAAYSPEIFGTISEITSKDLKKAVIFLNDALARIKLPSFFNLSDDTFFKTDIIDLAAKNNLLVGSSHETITIYSKVHNQFGFRVEYTRDLISKDELITIYLKNEELIQKILKTEGLPLTAEARIEQREGWNKPYITDFFPSQQERCTRANVQSASYFQGIYRPANNCNILPIVFNSLDTSLFNCLTIVHFNKNAQNFKMLPPVFINEGESINDAQISKMLGTEKKRTLLAVFCRYKMPKDDLAPLKGFKYQLYQGETDDNRQNRAKLSNFSCKCLEKLGGITAAIAETFLPDDGYFIGIDLGHTANGSERFSNLALTLFDHRGLLMGNSIQKQIPLQENLLETYCLNALQSLSKKIEKKPKHIVIHRDGRLHKKDIDILVKAISSIWGEILIDIVEIIKSGYPVIALKKEKNKVVNPLSGSSYQDHTHKYAILVTNAQADTQSQVINPIIVKHKYGQTDFHTIVEQVYWFTKIYTNNLYTSTRLPATTLKTNNIVGTSKKVHNSTYLG